AWLVCNAHQDESKLGAAIEKMKSYSFTIEFNPKLESELIRKSLITCSNIKKMGVFNALLSKLQEEDIEISPPLQKTILIAFCEHRHMNYAFDQWDRATQHLPYTVDRERKESDNIDDIGNIDDIENIDDIANIE